MSETGPAGPLQGLRVVELAGIGPGPHACMLLADLGAEVIRIDRPGGQPLTGGPSDFMNRGRPSVALDLKSPRGIETVLRLVERADILIEGMRPGTTERLGLGPEACWSVNPGLVYGRMTGWGQDGPLAKVAGHDMNYVALTGALASFGQDPRRPHFPANLVGDFGGGSTYLVIGVLSAVFEAQRSGRGQVVDAAIVDGTAHLNAMASGYRAAGELTLERGSNLLDGGVPWYDLYETADGRHLAVGPLEPQFYAEFLRVTGLVDAPAREDAENWPQLRKLFTETIGARSLAEWTKLFEGTDACVAPVLTLDEAPDHPHLKERGTFVVRDGDLQPAPAPRFSRTHARLGTPPPPVAGRDTKAALTAWGIADVADLIAEGVAVQA